MTHNRPARQLDRRQFVQAAGTASLVAGAGLVNFASAAPTRTSAAETIVNELHSTLSDEQKKTICFGFDDQKRSRVNANWHITKPEIDDFFTKAQVDLVHRVVKAVTSEDGYDRLKKQTLDDAGGIGAYSVALFGSQEGRGLQFVLTGRHLTLRADGNAVKNMAFGGPIVYGHGEDEVKENLYFYQTQKANEVFEALDAGQRKKALLQKAPGETQVALKGSKSKFPGIAAADLSQDQKELFESVIKVILSPYRQEDVDEVAQVLKKTGGLDKLHLAFYQQGDLEGDNVWDIWRVEGPGMVCHFRGAPHVHAYINIGIKS
ncbi:MAG: DUF3500 domain-containing protein [Pirellulaceae bacterium]|jgi:hypothetical protein